MTFACSLGRRLNDCDRSPVGSRERPGVSRWSKPPLELQAVHAVLRSAYELAENAVRLRLEAVTAADVELAKQASAAASGALMLLDRGRADLDLALRPPVLAGLVSQP